MSLIIKSCTTLYLLAIDVNLNLHNATPSLISHNPRGTDALSLDIPPCCHISLPYITSFDTKIIHQRIQNQMLACITLLSLKLLSLLQCWLFLLCPNATCYTYSLLACIHVDTKNLLNITCFLIATCVIIRKVKVCFVTK